MLSVRAAAQVGSKFGDDGARRLYPEYHALVAAMRQQQRAAASSAAAAAATAATAATGPVSLLGGSYAALAGVELRRVHADGSDAGPPNRVRTTSSWQCCKSYRP